jgi:hypothetical protein
MKRWIWLIALPLVSLSLLARNATGGGTKVWDQDGYDCTIHPDPLSGDTVASGALGTVRSEPSGSVEKWIGCYVDSIPGHAMVLCSASSEDGQQLMCASSDPALVAAVASMNADSYITFKTPIQSSPDLPAPPCSHISVENNSKYNVKSQ